MDKLKLIKEVYKRPVIWDTRTEEHHRRIGLTEAWQAVVEAVNAPEIDCRRTWASMRDQYRKHEKAKGYYSIITGHYSTWPYFGAMKFYKKCSKKSPELRKISEIRYDFFDNFDDETVKSRQRIKRGKAPKQYQKKGSRQSPELLKVSEIRYDYVDNFVDEETGDSQQQREVEECPRPEIKTEPELIIETYSLSNDGEEYDNEEDKTNFTRQDNKSYIAKKAATYSSLDQRNSGIRKNPKLSDTKTVETLQHIGDGDYNFLVSCLPKLKMMTELQKAQFRAKVANLMFEIASKSLAASTLDLVPSSQNNS